MITLLKNCLVFDGNSADLIEDATVVIENDIIREVSTGKQSDIDDAQSIDCGGRVLMPGLIDAHFHAYTPTFDFPANDQTPPPLMVSHATKILNETLLRGFTTVRDAGGGDIGLKLAIDQGLISGPRFYFSGKAISQTGGHGDMRPADTIELCSCGNYSGVVSRVADGVDEVRKAVREELHKGATQIKLMVSGGVASPTDPLWMSQFTDDEISTAVYEAGVRRTYVMAHCHTDDGARRCAQLGVRSIEHGSLITGKTAEFIASKGVYVVPTLSVINVLREHAPDIGLPPKSQEKIEGLYEQALEAVAACTKAGVKLGLGADLTDHAFHPLQGGELALRGQVNTPLEVLRSATSVNAEIMQQTGRLGCVAGGAYADLLALDFDPFKNLSAFSDPLENIPLIIRGGKVVKNTLTQ